MTAVPAYQVRVTLENGGEILTGLTARNPRKLSLKLAELERLLAALPVTEIHLEQLPGKRKRK